MQSVPDHISSVVNLTDRNIVDDVTQFFEQILYTLSFLILLMMNVNRSDESILCFIQFLRRRDLTVTGGFNQPKAQIQQKTTLN
ncbi:hypothetical protein HanRHA438_Chr13g0585211 [Helianthus annuus]|nr:hypothetical protein HanRHA438_Chr13g0585211 [Helianthus annuus]